MQSSRHFGRYCHGLWIRTNVFSMQRTDYNIDIDVRNEPLRMHGMIYLFMLFPNNRLSWQTSIVLSFVVIKFFRDLHLKISMSHKISYKKFLTFRSANKPFLYCEYDISLNMLCCLDGGNWTFPEQVLW